MKCIQCQTDNNLKERTEHGGCCKNCGHRFAFEPTSMGELKFTDPFFAKIIADISVENTLYFTPKQLGYFLDRRLKSRSYLVGLLFFWMFFNLLTTALFGQSLFLVFGKISFPMVVIIVNIFFIFGLYQGSKSNKLSLKERRQYARLLQILGIIILGGGNWLSIAVFNSFPLFAICTILGMVSIYLGITKFINQGNIPQTLLVGRSEVEAWLNRWTEINGNINKILPSPRSENRGNGEINAEITAYSFDRVVVTDSAAIAQFLIANNFHFENNCAVLSITGYPENIFNTVLEMLRRNPELKVYAIHDASPRGVALVNYLRTNPNWFSASTATIYDLGLIPRQVIKNPKLFMGNSQESAQEGRRLGPEIRSSLSAEEVTWLESGNFVELESFSPRKLLQIITQGIALSRSSIDSEAVTNLNYDDGDTYSSVGIFLVDSFG